MKICFRNIILQNPKRIFKYMQQFSQLSDKIFVKRKKYFWKSSMINLSRVQTVYNGSSNRTDEYFLFYCHFWLMSGFLSSLLALLSRKLIFIPKHVKGHFASRVTFCPKEVVVKKYIVFLLKFWFSIWEFVVKL